MVTDEMPWAVAIVGVLCFLSGVATATQRWVTAGFLISAAVGVALWLRYSVHLHLREAFDEGAGYGISTRRRIREIAERTVTKAPKIAEAWIKGGS